jgi:hypothetical protein
VRPSTSPSRHLLQQSTIRNENILNDRFLGIFDLVFQS